MEKVYFRNTVLTDDGRYIVVRGYYYKEATFIFKQKIFCY